VAVLAGLPGRARLIGTVMGRIGARVPWWRVLRADRTLAEEVRVEQARRLRAEGVRVQDGGRVPRSAFLPIGDEALHRRIRRARRRRARRAEVPEPDSTARVAARRPAASAPVGAPPPG
jgi:hypothetical protein